MPAASCRIMPARSISRCDTISASFGFSLRMGRKNRDSRMGTLEESVERRRPAVKPDRVGKHKGSRGFGSRQSRAKRARTANDGAFCLLRPYERAIKAQTRRKFSFSRKAYARLLMSGNIQLVFQRNFPEIGHQGLDPHVPMAGIGQRDVVDVPVAVAAGRGLAFHRLDA